MDGCASCRIGGPNVALEPLGDTGLSFCENCAGTVRAMAGLFTRQGLGLEEVLEKIAKRYLPVTESTAKIQDTGRVAELADAPGYKPAPEGS